MKLYDLPDPKGGTYKGTLIKDDDEAGFKYTVFRRISGNSQEFNQRVENCHHPEQGGWNLHHLHSKNIRGGKFKKLFSVSTPTFAEVSEMLGGQEQPAGSSDEESSGESGNEAVVEQHGAKQAVASDIAMCKILASVSQGLTRGRSSASVAGADWNSESGKKVLAGDEGSSINGRGGTPRKLGTLELGDPARLQARIDSMDVIAILAGKSLGRELRHGRDYLAELDACKQFKPQADILRFHVKRATLAAGLVPANLRGRPIDEMVADFDLVTQNGRMDLPTDTKNALVDRALRGLCDVPPNCQVLQAILMRMEPFVYSSDETMPVLGMFAPDIATCAPARLALMMCSSTVAKTT